LNPPGKADIPHFNLLGCKLLKINHL